MKTIFEIELDNQKFFIKDPNLFPYSHSTLEGQYDIVPVIPINGAVAKDMLSNLGRDRFYERYKVSAPARLMYFAINISNLPMLRNTLGLEYTSPNIKAYHKPTGQYITPLTYAVNQVKNEQDLLIVGELLRHRGNDLFINELAKTLKYKALLTTNDRFQFRACLMANYMQVLGGEYHGHIITNLLHKHDEEVDIVRQNAVGQDLLQNYNVSKDLLGANHLDPSLSEPYYVKMFNSNILDDSRRLMFNDKVYSIEERELDRLYNVSDKASNSVTFFRNSEEKADEYAPSELPPHISAFIFRKTINDLVKIQELQNFYRAFYTLKMEDVDFSEGLNHAYVSQIDHKHYQEVENELNQFIPHTIFLVSKTVERTLLENEYYETLAKITRPLLHQEVLSKAYVTLGKTAEAENVRNHDAGNKYNMPDKMILFMNLPDNEWSLQQKQKQSEEDLARKIKEKEEAQQEKGFFRRVFRL